MVLIFTDVFPSGRYYESGHTYKNFGMVALALGGGLAVFSLPKTDEDKE